MKRTVLPLVVYVIASGLLICGAYRLGRGPAKTASRVEVVFRGDDLALVNELPLEICPFPRESTALNVLEASEVVVFVGLENISFDTFWKILVYGGLVAPRNQCYSKRLFSKTEYGGLQEFCVFSAGQRVEYADAAAVLSVDILTDLDSANLKSAIEKVGDDCQMDFLCSVDSATGAQLVKALTLFRENTKPGDKVYIVPK